MQLDHRMRRKWCDEISKINKKLSAESSKEKNIFDIY